MSPRRWNLFILLTAIIFSVASVSSSNSDEGSKIFQILKALKNSNSVRALRRAFRRAALEVHPDRAPIVNSAPEGDISTSQGDEADSVDSANESVTASSSSSSTSPPEILSHESETDVNADVFIRLRAAYDYRRAELEGRPPPPGRSPFDPTWGQSSSSSSTTNTDSSSSSSSTSSSGAYSTGGDRCRAIKKARISSGVSWLSSWTLLTSTSPQSSTGEALVDLNITLDMSFRGGSIPFTAHRVAKCPFCKGSGVIINDTIPTGLLNNSCSTCGGSGFHTHGRCSWKKSGAKDERFMKNNSSNESAGNEDDITKDDFLSTEQADNGDTNEGETVNNKGNTGRNDKEKHEKEEEEGEEDDENEDDDFEKSFPGFGEAVHETCQDCCGTGKRLRDVHVCTECKGTGNVLRFHKGQIQLPRGLISDDRLPIQGIFTPHESELASMKADGVQFSQAPPGSLVTPQVVWYPSKLRILLDEEREIYPFKLDPYPHLSRVVSLSLTHYCKLRRFRIRLPGTGPPPLPPVFENGFLVPGEDTREVFEIRFPAAKSCFRGGGAGSLQHRMIGRGLPVSALRAKKETAGEDNQQSEEVGDFTLILQIQFPDRVGVAQSELFSECFGNESLPLIYSTAELVAELERLNKENEVKKYWFNYEDEWISARGRGL
jgi:DnaJ-class molecular chaperone